MKFSINSREVEAVQGNQLTTIEGISVASGQMLHG
jgi:hypothetical protein